MSSDWKEVKFSELCTITRGASLRPIKEFVQETGMPWVKIADATATSGRTINSTNEFIKEEGVAKSVEVYPGDLILTNSATPGLPMFSGINACIHDGWMLLRNFKGLNKNFAYWLLLHERRNLVMQGNGSVFTNLKTDILKNHIVNIPSLEEQKKIAYRLDLISEKIELNQQTNETLEAMAQAIFKSWFVDFDPVRAKIEATSAGRDPIRAAMAAIAGLPVPLHGQKSHSAEASWDRLDHMSHEQRTQLRQTAELFPDELVESEIGVVPKGWEVSEIGKEVNSVGGTTPRTKNPEYWDGGKIAWTTPKDLSNANSKILLETDRKITDEGLDQISSGLLPVDTVLMSSRAPVGYLALSKIPVAINQGYIAMICDKKLTPEYVLQWTESNMDMIKQHAGGSTFSEISKRNFRPLPVLVPSKEVLNAYSEKLGSLYDLITSNMEEIETLAKLRDTLLPKLISGEVEA